jgi:predicted dehydrogenase
MIRVAILGAGIGAEHLAAYRKLPDVFEVVAICDLDIQRATDIAGGIAATDRVEDVLGDPAIDLVDICLPPHLHVPMTLRVLASGKHAICEKPIANSLAEVDVLEQAQAASGKHLFPVFQYRFGPAMSQLQAAMKAGFATKTYAATFETHWCRKANYYDNPWRGTWAGEQGGALLGHAIHAHDLLTYLLGPIAKVHARTATLANDIETEDCASLSLEMQTGALVTSSVSLGAATDVSRIRLVFDGMTATSGGSPYAPMSGGWTFVARDNMRQSELDGLVAMAEAMPVGFLGYLREVARAVSNQRSVAVTLDDGRRSVELVTAAYLSARTGADVDLPLPETCPLYRGWLP